MVPFRRWVALSCTFAFRTTQCTVCRAAPFLGAATGHILINQTFAASFDALCFTDGCSSENIHGTHESEIAV